ncbi:hypothetical protein BS47DRAFT_1336644 [Hydnum rufescens UP504]|uniref:C2H2-type domain-containing protein n=1 Tax=Hydnum rufescens UP504 TaxID=1448309 RepID=A0A9P6B9B0_9AGAM|nr:hypothetical protein BS47DRAFT_1336644 [Hydnum rufescens UP504]
MPTPPHHRGRINPDTSGPVKKYPCVHCPRSFARAFNLKTHMATHDPNRIKAFVCRHQGCGRSFSRKHDLGRHLTSIHGSRDGIREDSEPSLVGHRSSAESLSTATSRGGSDGNNTGRMHRERVWCDGCGRGWIKGTREACECDEYRDE